MAEATGRAMLEEEVIALMVRFVLVLTVRGVVWWVTWQYLQLRLSWQWLDLAAEARTTVAMCSWVTVGKLWDLSVPQFLSISDGSHSSMYLIGFP